MQITLENTDKLVELRQGAAVMPARLWEGMTAGGVPVAAYITRVVCLEPERSAEFDADLLATRTPSTELADIDARLVL